MREATRGLLWACMVLAPATPWAADTTTDILQRIPAAARTVFQLYAQGERGTSSGSAVVVGPGLLATSCHVLNGATQAVVLQTGDALPVALVAADWRRDLCIMRSDQIDARAAPLIPASQVNKNDPVVSMGFTAGRFAYDLGEVTQTYSMAGSRVLRGSAAFAAGASGGGLFDAEGRLVGILTFYRLSRDKSMFFAIPADWVPEVLARGIQPRLPGVQPFWADAQDARLPFLQAVQYEFEGRWDRLADHARDWLAREPAALEAQDTLDLALSRVGGAH
ncbi:S1 family peptidase [Methyloversatilis thermotolerans]|uniref:S1 family peptidase n=1 Tax=Methyloversatilis thermotolerans TaxID=1346290 RepID=UPI00036ECD8E|nr:serine protease [Methyloversatilis thermotolerans]